MISYFETYYDWKGKVLENNHLQKARPGHFPLNMRLNLDSTDKNKPMSTQIARLRTMLVFSIFFCSEGFEKQL